MWETWKYILAIVVILLMGGLIITQSAEEISWDRVTYTVSRGDTLWGIAEMYAPEGMDKREYIYKVRKLNDDKVNLQIGDRLQVLVPSK